LTNHQREFYQFDFEQIQHSQKCEKDAQNRTNYVFQNKTSYSNIESASLRFQETEKSVGYVRSNAVPQCLTIKVIFLDLIQIEGFTKILSQKEDQREKSKIGKKLYNCK
jgi:hypothetical protein